MKDLVEYIVKQIVTSPEAVNVDEQVGEDGSVALTLTVDPVDMGLVIGKGGQTIKSIRKLLIVRAMGENKRVNLTLYEPEGSRPPKDAPIEDTQEEASSQEVIETQDPEPQEVEPAKQAQP